MHSQFWQEGRPTDPVDRPESSALWKGPGRPSGRPDRETYSLYLASVDRPVDRWHNGLKYDRWPIDRAVDRQVCQTPTASFSSPIKWGIWGLFSSRFSSGFFTSFLNSFKRFSPLVLEPIFPIKRRVYQRVFKRDFLEFSSITLILVFLTNT